MKKSASPYLFQSFVLHLTVLGGIGAIFYWLSVSAIKGELQRFEDVSISSEQKSKTQVKGSEPALPPLQESRSESSANPGEMDRYLQEIIARINRAKKYPDEARFKEQEGLVEALVEVAPDGKVLRVELTKTSAFESLNRAALSAIQRMGELPASPAKEPVKLRIPIQFQLQ